MAVPKPSPKKRGRVVTDVQQRIGLLLERDIGVFELRYFKRAPYPKKLFGVDDVIVHIQESPNSHEIKYNVEVRHGSDVEFTEDENNILTAYLPDTPKNRRILAKTIFIAKWEIIALYTNQGTIPKTQIQQEIKEQAEKLGIKPPPDMRSHAQMLRERRRPGQPEQPASAVPEPTPEPAKKAEPITKEVAENTVFERYEGLVAFLQNKHGQHWKATSEYKQVLKPEIDKLMGIVPGANKDTEDTKDTKPQEPGSERAPESDKGAAGTEKRAWERELPAGDLPAGGRSSSLVGD